MGARHELWHSAKTNASKNKLPLFGNMYTHSPFICNCCGEKEKVLLRHIYIWTPYTPNCLLGGAIYAYRYVYIRSIYTHSHIYTPERTSLYSQTGRMLTFASASPIPIMNRGFRMKTPNKNFNYLSHLNMPATFFTIKPRPARAERKQTQNNDIYLQSWNGVFELSNSTYVYQPPLFTAK